MKRAGTIFFCLLLILAFSTQIWAQQNELKTTLRKAEGHIDGKDWSKAISELQFLIGQLQELVMADAVAGLKDIFSPWVAEADESNQAGMAFLGGGFNVNITYKNPNTGERVKLEVVGNSPLVQTLSMWTSNPMFLGQGGRSLVRLGDSGDYKAVYSKEDNNLQLAYNKNLCTWTIYDSQNPKETLVKFGNYFANKQAPLLKPALGE